MNSKKVKLNTSAVEINTGDEYRFNIEFYVYKQDGKYIAYCPSLDLATSASNFNEAVSNFYECFQLYVETCVEAGTLHEDLLSHGWKLTKMSIVPPKSTTVLRKPEMKALIDSNINYERLSVPARLPLAV